MKDEDVYRLHFGPYHAPVAGRGELLFDERHGRIAVGDYSDGRIRWPLGQGRRWRMLILCGDLVKALRQESLTAVSHWWGISIFTGSKMRKALGISGQSEGTRRLCRARWRDLAPLRHWGKAVRVSHDPVVCMRRARQKCKDRNWPNQRLPAEADALLGTMYDEDIARKFGCTPSCIAQRRWRLGILSFRKVARRRITLDISRAKLTACRLALRLTQAAVGQRMGMSSYGTLERGTLRRLSIKNAERLAAALECRLEDIVLRHQPATKRIPDDSLLGTVSDSVLAKKWKLSKHAVTARRLQLGIPGAQTVRFSRLPRIPDDSLLGTQSDRKLAALWGLSVGRIRWRRLKLGIPTFEETHALAVWAHKLRARRLQLGFSKSETAKRSGLSHTYYATIENGHRKMFPAASVERIAGALKCSVETFASPL